MILNVNGLWCMFRRRNKECKCKKNCDWKCKDLLTNKNKWQCEDRLCRCQQQHNMKWLNKNKWSCQHDQKCETERKYQRDWLFLNEWKSEEYTQELLNEYLKKKSQSEQNQFFKRVWIEIIAAK
ncbi:hypothetical protein C1646_673581 [Rhizophagus diaphanus]|nr:hypothetical protein C1646_673581 [Rhizophagus diaphanus] [Rhizophagus sp. MUCL 43196]